MDLHHHGIGKKKMLNNLFSLATWWENESLGQLVYCHLVKSRDEVMYSSPYSIINPWRPSRAPKLFPKFQVIRSLQWRNGGPPWDSCLQYWKNQGQEWAKNSPFIGRSHASMSEQSKGGNGIAIVLFALMGYKILDITLDFQVWVVEHVKSICDFQILRIDPKGH